jgi:hypothetical protein
MKRIRLLAAAITLGLTGGLMAGTAPAAVAAPAGHRAPANIEVCYWTINSSYIRLFQAPNYDPFYTTKKGQYFTSVGSEQYAGGYYWLDGTDTSVNVSGWINVRYLSARNIISGANCYAV